MKIFGNIIAIVFWVCFIAFCCTGFYFFLISTTLDFWAGLVFIIVTVYSFDKAMEIFGI